MAKVRTTPVRKILIWIANYFNELKLQITAIVSTGSTDPKKYNSANPRIHGVSSFKATCLPKDSCRCICTVSIGRSHFSRHFTLKLETIMISEPPAIQPIFVPPPRNTSILYWYVVKAWNRLYLLLQTLHNQIWLRSVHPGFVVKSFSHTVSEWINVWASQAVRQWVIQLAHQSTSQSFI